MDLTMDIAQMSVGMHQMQAQQSLGIAVAKMAMDSGKDALELIEESTASLDPSLGNSIDVSA
ncbi:MAG: YjfB family protein [Centipeda sp. (in: firmicutes)]|uniref:YjfB family protein n=1 Tax=Selenomonas sp. oral taxon 920 TaxID=1884263 RepID=UPI000840D151|nr:YjfB family protein [Selenomonas sp. oral taxon 920]AOH48823.1 motility protein [Selenomonas sp. oral taxon 920]